MDQATAQGLADGYVAYWTTGDRSVLRMFSPNFYDIVSRTRGLVVFDVVGAALDESFADRSAELHLVAQNENRVMVWYTAHGRHIGNAFPRLRSAGEGQSGRLAAGPHLSLCR